RGGPEDGAAAARALPDRERHRKGARLDRVEEGGQPAQVSRAERALVIAHRGASAREWENSLAAFRAAAALGADAVELDVHATADGVIVVHHDEAIAGQRIARMTGKQLTALRLANGEPVPTLGDVLGLLGSALQAFVEVKSLPPQFDETLLGV